MENHESSTLLGPITHIVKLSIGPVLSANKGNLDLCLIDEVCDRSECNVSGSKIKRFSARPTRMISLKPSNPSSSRPSLYLVSVWMSKFPHTLPRDMLNFFTWVYLQKRTGFHYFRMNKKLLPGAFVPNSSARGCGVVFSTWRRMSSRVKMPCCPPPLRNAPSTCRVNGEC